MSAENIPTFTLIQSEDGTLGLTDPFGQWYAPVTPVRAFPISSPNTHLSLIDGDGVERAALDELAALAPDQRALVEAALVKREFMPVIERIEAVTRYVTPCTWTVATDRGQTDFVLKGEEAIRRLPAGKLLIADADGIQYLVPDFEALDERSRKLLDRFM